MAKKHALLVALYYFLLLPFISPAQQPKPVIDSTAIRQWVRLGQYNQDDVRISDNGQYFSYILETGCPGRHHLIIQSTKNDWKQQYPDVQQGSFSADSRKFFFMTADTLATVSLGTDNIDYIAGVASYMYPQGVNGQWLAYQLTNPEQELKLRNLLTGKQQSFKNVTGFLFSDSAIALLLITTNKENNTSLLRVEVASGQVTPIWSTADSNTLLASYAIDKDGKQISFGIEQKSGNTTKNSIWYWKIGMEKPILKVNEQSVGIPTGHSILPSLWYSANGQYIYFEIQAPWPPKPAQDDISVDIWSTSDTIAQPTQLKNPYPPPYTMIVSSTSNKVVQITGEWDQIMKIQTGKYSDHVVVRHNSTGDRFWLHQPDSNWLVSLKDGSRVLLKTKGWSEFWFSPMGRYLLYYDAGQGGHYFSYDLETETVKKISGTIPDGSLTWNYDFYLPQGKIPPGDAPASVGVAGFTQGDKAVFVYDNYDIWQLDFAGTKSPVNITNGYGRLHQIKFRITSEYNNPSYIPILPPDRPQTLTAFNMETKYNGFYRKPLFEKSNPVLLSMGPYYNYAYVQRELNNFTSNFRPLKAAKANKWIVKRESATEAPNYYLTTDFKEHKPLTHLQPQKTYNWLTAELIHFTRSDGITTRGILYKPENFDPSKKYPVIIQIYRHFSHRLHQFPNPEFTGSGLINIPWFTSQGYLVFTPDNYSATGQAVKSALMTVVSAAEHLSRLPYVDSKKLGLCGHSLSGGLVGYAIANTNLFAAAFEGAGNTEYISATLAVSSDWGPLLRSENLHGATMWERPDLYLNSAVMKADKISTPLLIFHCKKDGLPFEQGQALFLSLRRLGKTAWMLQYDRGTHVVHKMSKEAVDLSIRTTQFFDHYLKGSPTPKWMREGIPARLKGIERGYDLDQNSKLSLK